MRRLLPIWLLTSACAEKETVWKSSIGVIGGLMALVASVVLGILAECQQEPQLKERYDRICGVLLVLTAGLFLLA